MTLYWPAKDPDEVVDYLFDWSASMQSGEAIASKTVTASGVTLDSSTIAGETVQVWLSGGTAGSTARVTCRIVTNSTPARTFEEVAIVAIGTELISLERVKAHLGIDWDLTSELTALLAGYLAAAIRMVETRAQTILAARAVTQRFDGLVNAHGRSMLRLAWAPVVSVEGIDYLDSDGTQVTLTEGDGEYRRVAGIPCLLFPPVAGSWPSVLSESGSVSVRYTAGYGGIEEGPTPGDLEAAVLLMVGHLYHNREAVSEGGGAEMPLGVAAFCSPYRHTLI